MKMSAALKEPGIRLVENDEVVEEKKGRAGGRLPMKETPEDQAVTDHVYGVAADELRSFIEQAEQVEAEMRDLADRKKDIFAEAKARGYDVKCIKMIIKERSRDKDDVAEESAILDMYRAAVGLA